MLGIEPAGIVDNTLDNSVKLLQLMVLQLMQWLGAADGSAEDGALFGMELGADDGTSDGALLDHATTVGAEGASVETLVLLLLVLLLM